MIAVLDDDNGLSTGVRAGDLDGVLDCLSTGVEQCRALLMVAGSHPVERLADLDVPGVGGDHEAGVRELRDLGLHGRHDLGVRVAHRGDGDPRPHVDQGVAVGVDEDATPGADDVDGECDADPVRHGSELAGLERLGPGPGDVGEETALLGQFGGGGGRHGSPRVLTREGADLRVGGVSPAVNSRSGRLGA